MGTKIEMESKKMQKREDKQFIQLRHGVVELKKELAKHEKTLMAKAHPQKK